MESVVFFSFSTDLLRAVYRKESFHIQESGSMILSEYIFSVLGKHHQLLFR